MPRRNSRNGGMLLLNTRRAYLHIRWGRPFPSRIEQQPLRVEARNLLQDVITVLADEQRVKLPDVAARLRELAPGHEPYRQLNGKVLAEQLWDAGVLVTALHGYPQVYLDRVRAAVGERDARERTFGG